MLSIACGSRTEVGLVRAHNEDALLVGRRLWAVADGMGGHAAGDVASALAVASLARIDEGVDELRPDDLLRALEEANAALLRHGDEHPETFGLGTTVTGLARVVVDDTPQWAVFNVGDSRVYRFAGGVLSRVTVDHSEAEEMVLAGLISAEEARVHPFRNIVTRSLGSPLELLVDLWVLPLTPGERFLVCSDGLNSEIADDAIARILRDEPDADGAAGHLVAAALEAGGRDNVTAIVVDVTGHPEPADASA